MLKRLAYALVLGIAMQVAHADEAPIATTRTNRGATLFATYCSLCHGDAGKGDGRAAFLQQTPPADLTRSSRSAAYKYEMISNGGASLGRSSSMPPWRDALTAEQIADLVAYLQTLARTDAASSAPAKGESISTR